MDGESSSLSRPKTWPFTPFPEKFLFRGKTNRVRPSIESTFPRWHPTSWKLYRRASLWQSRQWRLRIGTTCSWNNCFGSWPVAGASNNATTPSPKKISCRLMIFENLENSRLKLPDPNHAIVHLQFLRVDHNHSCQQSIRDVQADYIQNLPNNLPTTVWIIFLRLHLIGESEKS